jgi:3D (Asp-Asp-Asp) domain-containing protein
MTPMTLAALTGFFVYGAFGGISTTTLLQTPPTEVQLEPTYPVYTVTMTAYNAVPGQTDDTPEITSIGAYTNSEIIAARSSDLADELPYGTVIDVVPATTTPNCGYKYVSDKIGLRVIGDAMHARMRNKIDILMDIKPISAQEGMMRNPAKAFGFCRDVQIVVVGRIDPRKMPETQSELAMMVGLSRFATAK